METYPNSPVGEFAAIRSVLVRSILASLATQYSLALYLLVAGSASLIKLVRSRLADAFEAVCPVSSPQYTLGTRASLALTSSNSWQHRFCTDPARLNYKAALQEWTQAHFKVLQSIGFRKPVMLRSVLR